MTGENKFERPVMIHRAILGSLERIIAILIEHTGGKWPFWLSPRQVIVLPVSQNYNTYAKQVCNLEVCPVITCYGFKVWKQLIDEGYYADLDDSDNKLGKKVREAQVYQYNFLLIVGEKEVESQTVSVRARDLQSESPQILPLPKFLDHLKDLTVHYK